MSQVQKLYSLPHVAELFELKLSWLYEQSRRDRIPGLVRVGRFVRVTEEGLAQIQGGALARKQGEH